MDSTVLEVDTSDRRLVDLTGEVLAFCSGRGDGLLNVFVPRCGEGIAVSAHDCGVLGQRNQSETVDVCDPAVIADPLILAVGVQLRHVNDLEACVPEDRGNVRLAQAPVDEEPRRWVVRRPAP